MERSGPFSSLCLAEPRPSKLLFPLEKQTRGNELTKVSFLLQTELRSSKTTAASSRPRLTRCVELFLICDRRSKDMKTTAGI